MKAFLGRAIQLVSSALRVGHVIARALRPDEREQLLGRAAGARAVLARLWRSALRVAVVVLGLSLFVATEYALARGIITWERSWFLILMSGVTVVAAVVAARATTVMLAIWLVLVPWTWHYPVRSANFYMGFDILALTLVALVVVVKSLVRRSKPAGLYAAEWLLLFSFVYLNVWPILQNWMKLGRFGFTVFGEFWQLLLVPTVLYFIVKSTLQNQRQVRFLLFTLVAVGLLWTLSGFYEHFTGYQWHSVLTGTNVPLEWRDVGRGRALGPSDGQVNPGTVLSVGIIILIHMTRYVRHGAKRFLGYALAGCMAAAIFFTYTRISYGGFAVAVVALFLMAKGRRGHYGLLLGALGLVVVVAAPIAMSDARFYDRMMNPTNYYGRKAMSMTAINIIKDHFWFGVGDLSDQSLLASYVSSKDHPRGKQKSLLAYPDNDYLVVFAKHGVFGFLVYYTAVFGFVVLMFRIRRDLADDGLMGANLASSAIAYTVVILVASTVTQLRSQPYLYYLLFALLAAVVRAKQMRDAEASQNALNAATASTAGVPGKMLVAGGAR